MIHTFCNNFGVRVLTFSNYSDSELCQNEPVAIGIPVWGAPSMWQQPSWTMLPFRTCFCVSCHGHFSSSGHIPFCCRLLCFNDRVSKPNTARSFRCHTSLHRLHFESQSVGCHSYEFAAGSKLLGSPAAAIVLNQPTIENTVDLGISGFASGTKNAQNKKIKKK